MLGNYNLPKSYKMESARKFEAHFPGSTAVLNPNDFNTVFYSEQAALVARAESQSAGEYFMESII